MNCSIISIIPFLSTDITRDKGSCTCTYSISKSYKKDRFEKKLIRFIREWTKRKPQSISEWNKFNDTLYKKYGFTDEEWHKAIRLTHSWTADENGLKKTKRIQRKKTLRDMYHDIDRSDMNDNPNGEAEIKAEDDWILDVYDEAYDEEDMQR